MKTKANRLFESAARLEFDPCDTAIEAKRRKLYRRAAIAGSTKAQFSLALDYAYGRNHHKDHRLALAWFRRAAQAGEELCSLLVKRGENSVARQIAAFRTLLRGL